MISIKLSVYFTNHLNNVIKLNDNLVDIEDSILEISNKKIYNTFTFITNGIYYDPTIIGDFVERIKVKFQINNNPIKEWYFIIDSIEYLENNNIKVYSKSKSFKYTKDKLNKIIQASSIESLITNLLPDITLNFDNFTDIPLEFDYTIEDKTIDEVVNDLSKITDFDYYFYNGILYLEDKKVIQKDDIQIATFRDIEDIEEFSTTTNKDESKINKIYINEKSTDNIIAEPQIVMDIHDSPQCCSPNEVLFYTDDNNNTYKISPINAFYLIYYTPLIKEPKTNLKIEKGERIVIENYKLENDNFVKLTAGIKEVLAVDGVENCSFEENYNILVFDYVESGELKISYKTNVLYGSIEHSKYPKDININIKHYNQIINYNHKIELNGYYPIPYNFTLNLISDWGIDNNNAVNKDVTISKKSGDVFVIIGTFISNYFGEIEFEINEYNTYKFETDGYEPLYLDWYVNNKELKMDEVS